MKNYCEVRGMRNGGRSDGVKRKFSLSSFQLIILGFAAAILVGALLLMLPISSKDRADINQIEKIIKDAGENGITTEDIISAASHDGIKAAEVNQTLEKLSRRGVIYSPKSGHYRHAG